MPALLLAQHDNRSLDKATLLVLGRAWPAYRSVVELAVECKALAQSEDSLESLQNAICTTLGRTLAETASMSVDDAAPTTIGALEDADAAGESERELRVAPTAPPTPPAPSAAPPATSSCSPGRSSSAPPPPPGPWASRR